MNSSLMATGTADRGVVADSAESSDGKVAVTGVVNCGNLGLPVGFMLSVSMVEDTLRVCSVVIMWQINTIDTGFRSSE